MTPSLLAAFSNLVDNLQCIFYNSLNNVYADDGINQPK